MLHQAEEKKTLRVGKSGSRGTFPSKTCSRSLDTVSAAMGRGFKAQTERFAKVWAVGGGIDTSIGQRVCPCKRNVGEFSATSTGLPLNSSVNWP